MFPHLQAAPLAATLVVARVPPTRSPLATCARVLAGLLPPIAKRGKEIKRLREIVRRLDFRDFNGFIRLKMRDEESCFRNIICLPICIKPPSHNYVLYKFTISLRSHHVTYIH